MKFLSNIYDPELPDAKQKIIIRANQSPEIAWKNHCIWLSDKVIGKPQATKSHTIEQLEEQNIVGVYSE